MVQCKDLFAEKRILWTSWIHHARPLGTKRGRLSANPENSKTHANSTTTPSPVEERPTSRGSSTQSEVLNEAGEYPLQTSLRSLQRGPVYHVLSLRIFKHADYGDLVIACILPRNAREADSSLSVLNAQCSNVKPEDNLYFEIIGHTGRTTVLRFFHIN
ncbi:hypothetical protein GE061_003611 [Apolygus lucorum]|uniref:Uncharacterized protein n=1 Tax=Apolygus lucorum TaxID=248454 RepID=A0A8S9X2L7_APOLU|nr:hypothetical protein GE061_003611 [Apolygus lucorum]